MNGLIKINGELLTALIEKYNDVFLKFVIFELHWIHFFWACSMTSV